MTKELKAAKPEVFQQARRPILLLGIANVTPDEYRSLMGKYRIYDADSVDDMARVVNEGNWSDAVVPLSEPIRFIAKMPLEPEEEDDK